MHKRRPPAASLGLLSGLALPVLALAERPALAQQNPVAQQGPADQARPGATPQADLPTDLPPDPQAWSAVPMDMPVSREAMALTGLSASQLFDIADQGRASGQFSDAETIYTALTHDPAVEIRSEARFRLGMMFADQKRYTDAAIAFRAILDEEPKAARVRLELARVLLAMGDEGSARQQIRQAQATGLPPDVAQLVDRFAAALRSNKRFGGNIEFALAPDSNMNRATDAKQLDTVIAPLNLSDDARQQSGLGAHIAGQVYARLPLTANLKLVPRLSGDGTLYRRSEFNDISGSALVGLEWQSGSSRVMPSVGVTWRSYGGDPYARTESADVRWIRRIGKRAQSDVGFSYGRTHYFNNALQDGNLFNLSAGVERAITARSGVGVTLNANRQTARDPGFSTASGAVTIIGWRDMGKVTVFANATARRLESDARLFPFTDRRKEWFLRAGVGATFRQVQVAGFSPVIRAAYERNISSVGIYDYRRKTIDFGITRAF